MVTAKEIFEEAVGNHARARLILEIFELIEVYQDYDSLIVELMKVRQREAGRLEELQQLLEICKRSL